MAIKVKTNNKHWVMICSIYLPSTNSTMGDFCQSLEELKHFCLKESFSDLIIMGDFNAHITGERSSRPSNSRGKLVQQLLSNLNLIAVNLKPVCKGPVQTYECSTAVSTIDYICLILPRKINEVTLILR